MSMDYAPPYHNIESAHMQNDLDLMDRQYDCVILATPHPHSNYTNTRPPPTQTCYRKRF